MPNWNDVLREIQEHHAHHIKQAQGAIDAVRRRYLAQLFAYTKRNVIAYYSGFLSKTDIAGIKGGKHFVGGSGEFLTGCVSCRMTSFLLKMAAFGCPLLAAFTWPLTLNLQLCSQSVHGGTIATKFETLYLVQGPKPGYPTISKVSLSLIEGGHQQAMGLYKTAIRPILFRLDAEWIHEQTIRVMENAGSLKSVQMSLSAIYGFNDSRLHSEVCGIHFRNPVGLAAGYDKNGRGIEGLAALGFGFIEIGSISADPSSGNPKPRLFRIPEDRAIVVHYGLPNDGAEVVAQRLARNHISVPLGGNIVKTNRGIPEPAEQIFKDYARATSVLQGSVDYLSFNLSCPNSEGGWDFFAQKGNTARLMTVLKELRMRCPVFLKVSPLGGVRAIETLLEEVEDADFVSGFIFNLPPGKPENLLTPKKILERMPGAVGGKPVEEFVNQMIRELYQRMDRTRYRIIGAGGIFCAEDAYRKIRLGSSLVQILTGMIYEGPGLVKSINRGLCRLLERDGFSNISEAVGTAEPPH